MMNIDTFAKTVAAAKAVGIEVKTAKDAEKFLALTGEKVATAAPVTTEKRGPGRPKGSKSKKSTEVVKPVKKAKKAPSKRGVPVEEGTSCAKEILAVLDKARKPLLLSDIMERLGKGGHTYQKVNVSVALGNLAKKGTITRDGELREYQFSLPKEAPAPVVAPAEAAPAPVVEPTA